jgi:hypothetical protein
MFHARSTGAIARGLSKGSHALIWTIRSVRPVMLRTPTPTRLLRVAVG